MMMATQPSSHVDELTQHENIRHPGAAIKRAKNEPK